MQCNAKYDVEQNRKTLFVTFRGFVQVDLSILRVVLISSLCLFVSFFLSFFFFPFFFISSSPSFVLSRSVFIFLLFRSADFFLGVSFLDLFLFFPYFPFYSGSCLGWYLRGVTIKYPT